MAYLYKSFSAKEPNNSWLFCRNKLQLKTTYESSPPCTQIIHDLFTTQARHSLCQARHRQRERVTEAIVALFFESADMIIKRIIIMICPDFKEVYCSILQQIKVHKHSTKLKKEIITFGFTKQLQFATPFHLANRACSKTCRLFDMK